MDSYYLTRPVTILARRYCSSRRAVTGSRESANTRGLYTSLQIFSRRIYVSWYDTQFSHYLSNYLHGFNLRERSADRSSFPILLLRSRTSLSSLRSAMLKPESKLYSIESIFLRPRKSACHRFTCRWIRRNLSFSTYSTV